MLTARLTEDKNWILVEGDIIEVKQLRLCFTKKIPSWFIIKSKNPDAVVEENFMNNFGLIPVGLWIELINSCKRFGYQISFIDDFDKKIRNPNISYETFNEYIKRLFHNSKLTPRDYQIDGVYKMIEFMRCCVEVSTSGGKTLMAYMLFRFMKDFLHFNHILFITPKTNLTTQSANKFVEYDHTNQMLTDWTYSEVHAKAKKKESYSRKVLNRMDELFAIEKRCIGKTADEVLKIRQRESKPIVEALFSMLRQDLPSRTGALLDATKYGLKIEEDLKSFLDNPYLERSNNRCERTVKDFVRSRKNFLFSYSLDGAKAAGIIRTVVRTARINGLDPEKYISYVLKQFSTKESSINARNNIQSLLPWSIKLPKELKGDLKKLPADLQKQLETKD